jgi:hypothetical protein
MGRPSSRLRAAISPCGKIAISPFRSNAMAESTLNTMLTGITALLIAVETPRLSRCWTASTKRTRKVKRSREVGKMPMTSSCVAQTALSASRISARCGPRMVIGIWTRAGHSTTRMKQSTRESGNKGTWPTRMELSLPILSMLKLSRIEWSFGFRILLVQNHFAVYFKITGKLGNC